MTNKRLANWFENRGDRFLYEESVNEGFKDFVLGSVVAGGLFGGTPNVSATQPAAIAQQEKVYHHDAIKEMVINDEGMRTTPYKDTRGIMTVGVGHNLEASGSRDTFVRAFGEEAGHKLHAHALKGKALTEDQARALFDADYEEHLNRTVKMIPNLHEHPAQVQAALVSGVYRGHVTDSPTFRKHFNAGRYEEASKEFLNRKEYRNPKTPKGVITRLNRDHQIFVNYSKSVKTK